MTFEERRAEQEKAYKEWIANGCPPLKVTVIYGNQFGEQGIGEFDYIDFAKEDAYYMSPELDSDLRLGQKVKVK